MVNVIMLIKGVRKGTTPLHHRVKKDERLF